MANVKSLINGDYKSVKFREYTRRYLTTVAIRFNARFGLLTPFHDLLVHFAAGSPMREYHKRSGAEGRA